MAFPVVQATNIGNNGASRTTSTTVNLPAGITASDLLVILFSCETTSAGPTTPTGWTLLFPRVTNGGNGMSVFYRVADGAEGASVAVAHGSNFTAYTTRRIDNCPGIIEAGTATTGTSATFDPPNLSPSWGSDDTLWIAIATNNGDDGLSSYPTNYTDGITDRSTNGGGNDQRASSARRNLAAASEDPGVFTLGGSRSWVANTLAIKPYQIRGTASVTEDADTLAAAGTPDPTWDIINAQLAGATVRIAPLARFDFASGEIRLWPGFGDVVIGAETWNGTVTDSAVGSISEIAAGPGLAVEEVTFSLAAGPGILDNFTADAEESAGRDAKVYLQFFDLRQTDGSGNWVEWEPLGEPLQIFFGKMGPLVAERMVPDKDPFSARFSRQLSVTASNWLHNRARPAYSFFSERDQKARHPGDNIFALVSQTAVAVVRWPKL